LRETWPAVEGTQRIVILYTQQSAYRRLDKIMEFFAGEYDIVIIGAGHAGCEAALAAARLGFKTAVFTINLDSIANMPCNPRIGGTSKGHLVREVDALGGEMGKVADKTFIQSKMLNKSKGPAVYSLRAQIDRRRYQIEMKHILEMQENLDVKQDEIIKIIAKDNVITGVQTQTGGIYNCKCVIMTTGTYLKAKIIIGDVTFSGGPDGLFPANKLSDSLKSFGIELFRFKTGTPARLNKRSIDFSKMEEHKGDEKIYPFSFENDELTREQESCWLTKTTERTHQIIKDNIHRSPLYSGLIEGVGPRYCPSIEDKIVRFPLRKAHQVFVEPIGIDTCEMYLQGMSSSLPEDVQALMIKSLPGLENVKIMRTGYAIEYDCINAMQLDLSLEFKNIKGLFSAGQINGSSGYEEAAAQGLIAGINAARKLQRKPPLILDRSDAYIGVLIDDLVTKGTKEPYRMMTSRAEYRLLLRQDNADSRLTEKGFEIGLISEIRHYKFIAKMNTIKNEIDRLAHTTVPPSQCVLDFLAKKNSTQIKSGIKLLDLLKRPEINYEDLAEIDSEVLDLPEVIKDQITIEIKYEGYIKRQHLDTIKFKRLENKKMPQSINYNEVWGLSLEARQKLSNLRPDSIGQASRISGVSPADISVLLIFMKQINPEMN
jgi:tRNA uridine 5-carboxymethylaminomethyl modification enzyme